jgi:hypothetical protein
VSLTSKVFTIFLLAAITMSLVIGIFRLKIENENQRVEIMIDYQEVKDLARDSGTSISEVLSQFADMGVVSAVLREYTPNDLVEEGTIIALSGKDILSDYYMADFPNVFIKRLVEEGAINQHHTYLLMDDAVLFRRLQEGLKHRLSDNDVSTFTFSSYSGKQRYGIDVDKELAFVLGLNLGFREEDILNITHGGLNIVPCLTTYTDNSEARIDMLFRQFADIDSVSMILFSNNEIPSYDEGLLAVARNTREREIAFGDIEFGQKKGKVALAELTDWKVIRVHTIGTREMRTLSPEAVVSRFVRAVRERNIRGIYVRIPETDVKTPVRSSLECVSDLNIQLKKRGYSIAPAVPFRRLSSDIISLFGIGIGVTAAGMLLLSVVSGLAEGYSVLLLVLLLGIFGGLVFSGWEILARQLMALAASVIFPVLGVVVVTMRNTENGNNDLPVHSRLMAVLLSVWRLICATVVTLGGCVLVVGLLAETRFMLNANSFLGVKAAYVLPLGCIVVCYFLRFMWNRRESLNTAMSRILDQPVKYGHVVILAIAAVCGLVYVTRSGNDPILKVPQLEQYIRNFLEYQLYARPRTKEFLVGHPFLLLASYLLLMRRRGGVLFFSLVLGIIGQISIVNSFAHIHTPLYMTLSRTSYSLIIGIVLGVVLVGIFEVGSGILMRSKGVQAVPGD